jgi:hypothetical protein
MIDHPLASTTHQNEAAAAPVFVIHPENRGFVSGATSFEDASRYRRRKGMLWLVIAILLALVAWLLYDRYHLVPDKDWYWFFFAAFIPLVLLNAASVLFEAWLYGRLAVGQFVDGEVVSSNLYWASHGMGFSCFLEATYAFVTLTGERKQRTVKVPRHDLWEKVSARYPGIRMFNQSAEERSHMREFALQPGTPLLVCCVTDTFFRVM